MPRSKAVSMLNDSKPQSSPSTTIANNSESEKDLTAPKSSGRKRAIELTERPSRNAERLIAQAKPVYKAESDSEEEVTVATPRKRTKATPKKIEKTAQTKATAAIADNSEAEDDSKKIKRRRKTKEEKEAEAMPLAARTVGCKMLVGAHVSAAGGVQNSVTNAVRIGSNAFALFLKSQRKWANPPMKAEAVSSFHELTISNSYSPAAHILPHGSYLVNLAQADADKAKIAYESFVDDLQRCETLGIRLYNFHPGNTNGMPRPEAIARLAKQLNRAHKETKTVVTLLENMAAAPESNTIGARFEDLRDVIALVEDKQRVGVCLDTCHSFAAGYDLRSPAAFNETMAEFDNIVGCHYLRAMHLNDSKAPLGAHRDLHQNIGLGFLGLRAFHTLMNDSRFAGMPLVLETPVESKDENGKAIEDDGVYAREIKLLESLVGMDPEGENFKVVERELAEKGRTEREKYRVAFEKKVEKEKKEKAAPRKTRRKQAENEHGTVSDGSEDET